MLACAFWMSHKYYGNQKERDRAERSRKRNESKGKYVFDHIKIDDKLSRGNKLNLYIYELDLVPRAFWPCNAMP